MPFAFESNRRGFMKILAASPLLAQIAAQQFYEKSASAIGLDPRGNVYSRLGVKTVINCRGTWTYLSGSLQFPEVLDAQAEAGRYFVNIVELQRAVGRRLAELTGAESGISPLAQPVRWLLPPLPASPAMTPNSFGNFLTPPASSTKSSWSAAAAHSTAPSVSLVRSSSSSKSLTTSRTPSTPTPPGFTPQT